MAKLGFFISFEGGEGAGKSTQIARLQKKLRQKRYDVVVTREPGGSPGAEAVRSVILSGAVEPLGTAMEAILFAAARADHIEQIIRPAVERGAIVLCDRFVDSSRVYQGATGNLSEEFLGELERATVGPFMPDLTLIFDLDPQVGMRRAAARRGNAAPDRFEKETLETQEARRAAFLAIAAREPDRCIIVNAAQSIEAVEDQVTDAVFAALAERVARAFQAGEP